VPVSDAAARRAADWLAAWHRAGLLGSDPEVRAYVADLIRFVGERAMDENGLELTSTSPRVELDAAAWDQLLARVRELEADNARLREGLRQFRDAWENAASGFDGLTTHSCDELDAASALAAELLGDSQ